MPASIRTGLDSAWAIFDAAQTPGGSKTRAEFEAMVYEAQQHKRNRRRAGIAAFAALEVSWGLVAAAIVASPKTNLPQPGALTIDFVADDVTPDEDVDVTMTHTITGGLWTEGAYTVEDGPVGGGIVGDTVIVPADTTAIFSFTLAGTYTLRLTVTDGSGSTYIEKVDYIEVSEPA